MGWMPGADRSVLATDTNSRTRLTRCDGIIIHTIGGGPGPAAAATWSVRRDGHIWQHRDDDMRTSANLDGNPYYLAIENGDRGPGWPAWDVNRPEQIPPMTPEQVEANARILEHVWATKGVPLVLMPDSLAGRRGVGYHRQGIDGNWAGYRYKGRVPGGLHWSSVFGKLCPVEPRIDQVITVIIPRARVLAGLQEGTTMQWSDPLDPSDGALDTSHAPAGKVLRGAYDWGGWNGRKLDELLKKVDQLLVAGPSAAAGPIDYDKLALALLRNMAAPS